MQILKPEYVHKDERRTLTQLFTANIAQVNVYDAKRGSILGDHYHKKTNEYFYISKGTIALKVNDLIKKTKSETILNRGSAFIVRPLEHHTIECVTDVRILSFLTRPYTDTYPDIYKDS